MPLPRLPRTTWETVEIIRHKGIATRNDIVSELELSWSSVSNIIGELQEKNLIAIHENENESDANRKLPGRVSGSFKINPAYGYFAGISIGSNFIKLELIDFSFKPLDLSSKKYKYPVGKSLSDILLQIQDLIDKFCTEHQELVPKLLGIGFAWPGVVDHFNKIARFSPTLNFFKELGLSDMINQRQLENFRSLNMVVDHNAKCSVLAEKYIGEFDFKYRLENNIVSVILANNISCGILLDNKVQRGLSNYGGQLGNFENNIESKQTILEQELVNTLGKAAVDDNQLNNPNEVDFEKVGIILGKGLSYLINLLNPELIVLTGRLSKAYDLFYPHLRESLHNSCSRYNLEKMRIEKTKLYRTSTTLGAAINSYYDELTKICGRSFYFPTESTQRIARI